MPQFKIWIKTRKGFERFEFVGAGSKEEVRRAYEGTLKWGEKIKGIENLTCNTPKQKRLDKYLQLKNT